MSQPEPNPAHGDVCDDSTHVVHKILKRRARVLSIGAFVLAGMLFAVSATTNGFGPIRRTATQLPDLVRQENLRVQNAEARRSKLQEQIDRAIEDVADSQVQLNQQKSNAIAPAAQLTAVVGSGIQITMTDAPSGAIAQRGIDPDQLLVHQQDIEGVVNALWTGGAEAVTVMDQRLISTSAVQCAGNTLRLNGRLFSPPYVISAIGDPKKLQDSLTASTSVQSFKRDAVKLGLGFDVEEFTNRILPGYDGTMELHHARAVE